MKKHDENKDIKSLAKVCKISMYDKTISCADITKIGIRRWGKVDFLTRYCGWHFVFDKSAKVTQVLDTTPTSAREQKKEKKVPKLKDKKSK